MSIFATAGRANGNKCSRVYDVNRSSAITINVVRLRFSRSLRRCNVVVVVIAWIMYLYAVHFNGNRVSVFSSTIYLSCRDSDNKSTD